jgi:hypothetical protein
VLGILSVRWRRQKRGFDGVNADKRALRSLGLLRDEHMSFDEDVPEEATIR